MPQTLVFAVVSVAATIAVHVGALRRLALSVAQRATPEGSAGCLDCAYQRQARPGLSMPRMYSI